MPGISPPNAGSSPPPIRNWLQLDTINLAVWLLFWAFMIITADAFLEGRILRRASLFGKFVALGPLPIFAVGLVANILAFRRHGSRLPVHFIRVALSVTYWFCVSFASLTLGVSLGDQIFSIGGFLGCSIYYWYITKMHLQDSRQNV